jgi:thioredoxin-related protein
MYAMYTRLISLSLLLAVGSSSALAARPFDDSIVQQAQYPDWFLESFLDLDQDLDGAVAAGKKGLIVVFGTAGCSYCYKFAEETLRDPEVERLVRQNFDVVYLDIFSDVRMTSPQGEAMSVKAFAKQQGADYTPAIYFYDDAGRGVLRLIGFYSAPRFAAAVRYAAEGHYESGSLRDYLVASVRAAAPRPAVDDPIIDGPPYNLDRRAGGAERHLMVVFDGPDCAECAYLFEDLFKDPQLRPQLQRLEVVRLRLDNDDLLVGPDGQPTSAAAWYAKLGFHRTPAFAFFDQRGDAVMLTDAMMLRQRFDNTLGYVLEQAYLEGISYQRFARRRAMAKLSTGAE